MDSELSESGDKCVNEDNERDEASVPESEAGCISSSASSVSSHVGEVTDDAVNSGNWYQLAHDAYYIVIAYAKYLTIWYPLVTI
jgi:hypothetical protein